MQHFAYEAKCCTVSCLTEEKLFCMVKEMFKILDRIFKIEENRSTLKKEVIGGFTTFATMSYIIFVQPLVLSAIGMDKGAVFVATCLSAAFATLLMAILANYPIALAPAMGHNFYFVYMVCLGMGINWQTALGANFISGAIFIALVFFGLREKLINAVPASLKSAIAVGIGLLIALIGFEWAGIVVKNPGTIIGLGNFKNPYTLLSFLGIFVISLLMARRIKGAIIIGILLNAALALLLGLVKFEGFISPIPSIKPTFLKLNIASALNWRMLGVIFTLLFLDLFDTVGTLIGIGKEGGFLKEGKLPRAKKALLSDALGTVGGTLLGTSTVTSYIESSTGVAEGARTGLASLITALLFLASLFLYPLVKIIAAGFTIKSITLYPIIAPALIVVGVLMMNQAKNINWSDFTESIPAFLTITIIAFSFSITEGISCGFIFYCLLKALSGRRKEVSPLVAIFAFLFILRYIFLK